MKKKLILATIIVLSLATAIWAAISVDQGHSTVHGWYVTTGEITFGASMALMRYPSIGFDESGPGAGGGYDRTGRTRGRMNGRGRY